MAPPTPAYEDAHFLRRPQRQPRSPSAPDVPPPAPGAADAPEVSPTLPLSPTPVHTLLRDVTLAPAGSGYSALLLGGLPVDRVELPVAIKLTPEARKASCATGDAKAETDTLSFVIRDLTRRTPHLVRVIGRVRATLPADGHNLSAEDRNLISQLYARLGDGPFHGVVMERLDGPTLSRLLADEEALPADSVAQILFQVVYTLKVFAAAGVQQHDFSFENVIVQALEQPVHIMYDAEVAMTADYMPVIIDWDHATKVDTPTDPGNIRNESTEPTTSKVDLAAFFAEAQATCCGAALWEVFGNVAGTEILRFYKRNPMRNWRRARDTACAAITDVLSVPLPSYGGVMQAIVAHHPRAFIPDVLPGDGYRRRLFRSDV